MGQLLDPEYRFYIDSGRLWMEHAGGNNVDRAIKVADVSDKSNSALCFSQCHQSPADGSQIRLTLIAQAEGQTRTFHHLVRDPVHLFQTGRLSLSGRHKVLSTASPIEKITHSADGFFASTSAGDAFFVQSAGGRSQVTMLKAASDADTSGGALNDILAAKAGLATFIDNLAKELPNIAGAVEKKVSQEVLSAFAAKVTAIQSDLDTLFNKPLTDFFSKTPSATSTTALMAGISGVVAPNATPASARASVGASSSGSRQPERQELHALLLKKMDIGRYLDPFSPSTMMAFGPVVDSDAVTADGSDPLDALGKLFEPLSQTLDARTLVKLTGMATDDLVKALSGSVPFSTVIDDFFSLFKIDEITTHFSTILSGGQVSALVSKIGIQTYLDTPIKNDFFQAFYQHFFPGQSLTARDLIAFAMAIVAFSVAEIQGKESEFHDTFSVPANLAAITSLPANLVTIIGGTASPAGPALNGHAPVVATNAAFAAMADTESVALEVVGIVSAVVLTLAVGVAGVFQFGTGLIASSIVGGVAGGVGQTVGGLAFKQTLEDSGENLLAGFASGFAGTFVATLLGNNLFGIWAQKGDTPTARLNAFNIIKLGGTLLLGGGGGGVVSSVIKTKLATGTVKFDDPISLAAGITAGLGGGAMGCGLHFLPPITSGQCMQIAMSNAEATLFRMRAINPPEPAGPPVMNNATPLPAANPAFPAVSPNYTLGVYPTIFQSALANPTDGFSYALVKWQEFVDMDNDYVNQRQKLFWLQAGPGGAAPPADQQTDMIIGVHGIGRYVFPCLSYRPAGGGNVVEFSRPFYKDEFVEFVNQDTHVTTYLNGIRNNQHRQPRIKLAVCFSALPLGCCSLGQKLATRLNAEVFASRPAIKPWLDGNNNPYVPCLGGWIRYTP